MNSNELSAEQKMKLTFKRFISKRLNDFFNIESLIAEYSASTMVPLSKLYNWAIELQLGEECLLLENKRRIEKFYGC